MYLDLGLTVSYVGPPAAAVLGESLELAPFGKLLYSSDAYGLPELYLLGAHTFRHALGELWRPGGRGGVGAGRRAPDRRAGRGAERPRAYRLTGP